MVTAPGIGGALSSMIVTFPYSNEAITFVFLAFTLLSAISAIVALIDIFRSVIGYSYQKIPSSAALVTHFEDLKNWHRNNGADSAQIIQESKKDFDIYFESRLSEAADHNGNNNLRRGNYIHDSTVAIAFALAFMGMCSPFFIYTKSNDNENTHRAEVVNPVILSSAAQKMADKENSGNNDSGSQNTTLAQQPAAPAQTTQPDKRQPSVFAPRTGPRIQHDGWIRAVA